MAEKGKRPNARPNSHNSKSGNKQRTASAPSRDGQEKTREASNRDGGSLDHPLSVVGVGASADLSESIITKARAGIYPESVAADIPSDRLRRFFRRTESGYQLSKNIRDMVVFAKQDLTKDPPSSKLDMISCRNGMIYMSHVLQKRMLPLFLYALNPAGILFLGSSETIACLSSMIAQSCFAS
jgi:chemotaxis methyl-accepting protein methylase